MFAESIVDLQEQARQRLAPQVYDYFAGGADDEITLRANTAGFDRRALLPRVLRGVAKRDLGVAVLGSTMSMPVFLSPTAFHTLAHPDGERATARAAADAGVVMIVSTASTTAVEAVTEYAGEAWFQLYVQPDREFTRALVERAERAGCTAVVVTADSPVFGRRRRDLRNGFTELPGGLVCENMRDATGAVRDIEFDAALSFADLGWLREVTALPLVVKGIVRADDARSAVDAGAAAVFVSNHGGRQLDGMPSTVDVLDAVVAEVGAEVPVLLDGGVRRGTDVLKACALGASAVGIGRPVLWGLAVGGEAGVRWVLDQIRQELDRAMALCGCGSIADVTPDLVVRP